MKSGLFLTGILFALTVLSQTPTQAANTEFGGNFKAAKKAYPAIKKSLCPGSVTPDCDLLELRVISNWAYTSYSMYDRELSSSALYKWNGKSWQTLIHAPGQASIDAAIAFGVPQSIAQVLVPVTCPFANLQVYRLKKVDIIDCTAWDLLIARNTLYARKGRPFHAKILRDYFMSWPWYKPNPRYHEGLLSELEKANAKLIMQVEKEKGYL